MNTLGSLLSCLLKIKHRVQVRLAEHTSFSKFLFPVNCVQNFVSFFEIISKEIDFLIKDTNCPFFSSYSCTKSFTLISCSHITSVFFVNVFHTTVGSGVAVACC